MNHRVGGRKFGVPSDQRRALLKSLVRALLTYQTIKTTDTRAKDVRSIAEKLITTAKVDSLHARRQVRRYIQDETLIHHLFTQIAPEFKNTTCRLRPGSFVSEFAAATPHLSFSYLWQQRKPSVCRSSQTKSERARIDRQRSGPREQRRSDLCRRARVT